MKPRVICKYLNYSIFLFILLPSVNIFAVKKNSGTKLNPPKKKQVVVKPANNIAFKKDKLLEKSSIEKEDVYPREDLNVGPKYITEVVQPNDFSLKFYLGGGVPIFPSLSYMEQAGLDLFSGKYYFNAGALIPGFIGPSSPLRFDAFVTSFASSDSSGLSNISGGTLTGNTELSIYGFSVAQIFYPLDYFLIHAGFGMASHTFKVNYSKSQIFIANQTQTLPNYTTTKWAPLVTLAFGADIPIWQKVRAQIIADYQIHLFNDKTGAYFVYSLNLSYSF